MFFAYFVLGKVDFFDSTLTKCSTNYFEPFIRKRIPRKIKRFDRIALDGGAKLLGIEISNILGDQFHMLILTLRCLKFVHISKCLSLFDGADRSGRSRSFLLDTRRRGLAVLQTTGANQAAVERLLLRRVGLVCFPPCAEVILVIPKAEAAELRGGAARGSQWSLCYQLCFQRLLRSLELLIRSEFLLRVVILGAQEKRWLPQAKLAVVLQELLVHFEYSSSLLCSWLSHGGVDSILHVDELELV